MRNPQAAAHLHRSGRPAVEAVGDFLDRRDVALGRPVDQPLRDRAQRLVVLAGGGKLHAQCLADTWRSIAVITRAARLERSDSRERSNHMSLLATSGLSA